MWKSTASWARGTEGNTSQTAGSQAYKKRLSFPPVHGFGEWSVKQYVLFVAHAFVCCRLPHFRLRAGRTHRRGLSFRQARGY